MYELLAQFHIMMLKYEKIIKDEKEGKPIDKEEKERIEKVIKRLKKKYEKANIS